MIRRSGSALARRIAAAALLALGVAQAGGAQTGWRLLLLDDEDCEYCLRWNEQVGVVYARTQEGRLARLVRAPLAHGVPDDVRLERAVSFTPTFVLLDPGGRERGRITGYLGEDQFWGLLGALLEREGLR